VRLPVGGGVGGSGLGSIEDSSLVMLGYLCPRAPPPAVPFKWPKMTFRFMPQKDDKMGHRRLIAHRWRLERESSFDHFNLSESGCGSWLNRVK
jgi:hypothetical protein